MADITQIEIPTNPNNSTTATYDIAANAADISCTAIYNKTNVEEALSAIASQISSLSDRLKSLGV